MRAFALFLLSATAAFAGEFTVLSNGFRLHAASHVVQGGKVKLQTDQGLIELPEASVTGFELEEYAPPPAPVPTPTPAPAIAAAQPATPKQLITGAAHLAGLPPELVHSIARAESAYRVNAVSPKGAIGLMQLMPGTAAALNADPFDPKQNAEAGAKYLRDLLIRYQDDPHQVTKAIAAYNAGPGAVDKYHGIPPYRETLQYVNRVVREYLKSQESN